MKKLHKYLVFLIALMPFLAPLGFLELKWLLSPSDMKTAMGVFVVTSGLFTWLVISLINKKINIKYNLIYWPIFGFITWNFITLLWVEDGYLAIVMLTQFTVASLAFFLSINLFNNFNKIEFFIKAIVISLVFVSIIGLLQIYFSHNDLIDQFFIQMAVPAATFGNRNVASHFVLMTLPLSFALMLSSKSNRQIFLYSFALTIAAWFLIYITARQAYVAITAELLVLFLFFTLDKWKNKDKAVLAIMDNKKGKSIAIFSILSFLVFVANFTNQGFSVESYSNSKIERIQSILVDEHNQRIPAWRNTIEMIKDHPIIGVGVGQWQAQYPLYYDRVMKDIEFGEATRIIRLHNDYLEIFANVGVIGYVFLLWLAWFMIRQIWRILSDHSNEYRVYILGLTLGIIGFLVVAMFSFPVRVFHSIFILFIYIGIIASIDSHIKVFKFNKKRHYFPVIAVGFFSIFVTMKALDWVIARHFNVASASLQHHGYNELAIKKGFTSVMLNSKAPEYFLTTAQALYSNGRIDESILYFKKALDISPFNSLVLLDLSTAYKDKKDTEMERKVLEFILRFDSKNVLASARLVINLSKNKMLKEATIVYKEMKSNFEYFKDRSNFGPYHHEIAKTAHFVQDYTYMMYIYKDLVSRYPIAENFAKLAATQYYFLNNQSEGVRYYKKAIELNPKVVEYEEINKLINKYESNSK